MRRLFILASLAHSLAAAPVRAPKDWPVTAVFPAAPAVRDLKAPAYVYAGAADLNFLGENFAILRFVWPPGTAFTHDGSDALVRRAYLTSESRVLEQSLDATVAGLPARKYVIADEHSNRSIELRIFFVRNEQYMLTYERSFGFDESPEAKEFFASVEVSPALSTAAPSANPATEYVSKKKRDEIEELFRLTGVTKLATQIAAQVVAQEKAKNPGLSGEFLDGVAARINPEELAEKLVPIYDKYYSEDDLNAIIAFYSSPVGKKVISVTPDVIRESMKAGSEWGQNLAAQAIADQMAAKDKK